MVGRLVVAVLMVLILTALYLALVDTRSFAQEKTSIKEATESEDLTEFMRKLRERFESEIPATIAWTILLFCIGVFGKFLQQLRSLLDAEEDSQKRNVIWSNIAGSGLDLILVAIGLIIAWSIKASGSTFGGFIILCETMLYLLLSVVGGLLRRRYKADSHWLWSGTGFCTVMLPSILGVILFGFSSLVFAVG
ncbi:hypothetical protein ACFL6S_05035 [Candidatus Poribacteria bacterium]